MKKLSMLLLLVCILKTTVAQKDTEAEKYIRAARAASNEAIFKKDVAGVAKYWKADYVEISSDGSLISGKEDVVADWTKMFEKYPTVRFERKLAKIEFASGGNVIVETGMLTYSSPNNYKGYYTALWRKVDGVWVTQMENFVSIY